MRSEKMTLLFVPWVIFLLCFFWISDQIIPNQIPSKTIFTKKRVGRFILASFIGGILGVVSMNSLPSINKLSVHTTGLEEIRQEESILEIVNIYRSNGTDPKEPSFHVSTSGSCQSLAQSYLCNGASEGSIEIEDFSADGMEIVFQGFPNGAQAEIVWNGYSQIFDTRMDTYDQFELLLPYEYNFFRQSLFRKVEFIVIVISIIVTIFMVFELVLSLFRVINTKRLFTNYPKFRIVMLVFLLAIGINMIHFTWFQQHDIFKLQRVHGNSLIDLDNSSHDNINQFQVYETYYQLFRGHELIISPQAMQLSKLSPVTLNNFSRASLVSERDYSYLLSENQYDIVKDQKRVEIKPMGRSRNGFVFIQEEGAVLRQVCLWVYEDIFYFIPVRDDITCIEEMVK
jgi:hypothetical protein